jgi:hypothetical protein
MFSQSGNSSPRAFRYASARVPLAGFVAFQMPHAASCCALRPSSRAGMVDMMACAAVA